MDYTVKGLKTFRGMEGDGFNANLYKGTKKIAFVIDSAHGGCFNYEWVSKEAREDFKAFLATLPVQEWPEDMGGGEYTMTDDMFVGDLVSSAIEDKYWKRQCKTKTIFTTTETKPDEFVQIMHLYTPKVKEHLQAKYGDDLVEIINERYL